MQVSPQLTLVVNEALMTEEYKEYQLFNHEDAPKQSFEN